MLVRGVSKGHLWPHDLSIPARSFFINAREGREESPGESAFSSNRPQTGRSSSLCLGDSRLGDRQVELILNAVPGPIYVSINACIDYIQIGNKMFIVGEDPQLNFHLLLVNDQVLMKIFPSLNGKKHCYRLKRESCSLHPSVMSLFRCPVHLSHCQVCTEDTCPIGI